jgi:hypothetical protein
MRYLEGSTCFLKELQVKVNKWHAKEMQEVQQKAKRAAAEGRVSSKDEPGTCTVAGVAAGLGGLALTLAPETGGASIVIAAAGVIYSVGDASGQC